MTRLVEAKIDHITVHCSATRPSQDIGVKEIKRWHIKRGFSDVGYHYIIRRDGSIEAGRPEHVTGAHVRWQNTGNLGVCLVGGVSEDDVDVPENNFTDKQWATLKNLLRRLHLKYPNADILGHRDWPDVKKACPSFDVKSWIKENL